MSFDVRTRRGVIERITFVTAISLLTATTLTAIGFVCLFGFNLNRTFSSTDAVWLAVIASTVIPLIIAPPASYRASMLMRDVLIARDAFEALSRIDQLTGLRNRRGFDDDAARLLAEPGVAPVSVLMADLDYFKQVNDRFGHAFGDAALRHVAEMLRAETADWAATLGRQGGDEFAVALVGATTDEALAIAERVKQACAARPLCCDGLTGVVTVSVGVATSLDRSEPLTRIMSRADEALLAAKQAGRDRVMGLAPAES